MKKKNIAILLLLPYIISLLGVITVNITFKTFENDISHIEWEYSDIEVFKLEGTRHRLSAQGVNTYNYPLAEGNNLVWSVANSDGATEPHAEIVEEDGEFYLVPLSAGTVVITCSNQKGNISRRTTAIIYLNSVIVVQTQIQSSQNNIDDTIYYGEYDLKDGKKVKAEIALSITCAPTSLSETLYVADATSNVKVDLKNQTAKITGSGPASFTLAGGVDEDSKTSFTYSFDVVKNGVNVYTYDDLLNCTNRSKDGEIVVLRKSFESLTNAYVQSGNSVLLQNGAPVLKSNNVELFGSYDVKKGTFAFADEVYRFETTYNQSYIQQWNEFAKTNADYKEISNLLNVGLHVQKDFYGNGYTLNLHNLAYPSGGYEVTDQETGDVSFIPELADSDLFRGPLPFYTLGNPNSMPLITAFGQDNIGIYVDGDGITVNDVNIKNCDFGNRFANLNYTGTVMEVYGDNVTVKNSVLQNGKNVMRVFSSQGVQIQNCLLQNARNFLLTAGCNEYIPIDGSKTFTFKDATGASVTATIDDYFAAGTGTGDALLETYLTGNYPDKNLMRAALQSIQDSLSETGVSFGGSVTIEDSLFYRSGISSICLESFFNGPFLYNASPSLIAELFSIFTEGSRPLVPLTPTNVSGISYPVELKVTGSTKFFDYKSAEDMDLSALIDENISTIVQSLMQELGKEQEINITIDDIFPLKRMLYADAAKKGSIYSSEGTSYVNIPIAFYGGGLNLSTVSFEGLESEAQMNPTLAVEWVDSYLNIPAASKDNLMVMMQGVMQKTVTVVTGFEPFRFVCVKGDGYLYKQTPNVSELRENHQR